MLKRPQILLLALVSMVFATLLFAPAQASAATLAEDAERFVRYRAIHGCLAMKDLEGTSPTRVVNGDWWEEEIGRILHRDLGGALYSGKNPAISCENGDGDKFIADSATVLGFSNPGAMWCSIQPGAYRDNEGSGNEFEKCVTGSGDYDGSGSKTAQANQFTEGIKNYSSIKTGFPFEATGAVKYYIYFETFKKFCDASREKDYIASADKALADSKEYVVVNEVVLEDGTPKVVPALYKVDADDGEDHNIEGVWSLPDGKMYDLNCGEIAAKTWEFDDDYGRYIAANPDEAIDPILGGGATEPVCSAGALGWIFCPLTEFISDATRKVAEVLEDRLIYPALTTSDQGKAIRTIWGTVLGIANVGLVIAFLIVIFSQATSIGLSSYGIKKVLPRVVAAAILMNLSFFICAIAVDLANIVGVSIKAIIENGIKSLPATGGTVDASYSWSSTIVAILGLGLAVLTGAIALLFPVLLAAFFAVLTAFLVIAAREVLVTLLIIVAPLAFLAWILPNTEQWFTKWRKLFTTMLLMFPLVMIIFYGSLLLSNVILVSADGGGDGDPDLMVNVIALGVLTVPLFSLPFIMKSAGGVLDRLGVIVNNRNKGLIDRNRQWAKGQSQRTRENNMARLTAADWGKNQSGLSGKVKRGASGSANFIGGYTTRRDSKRASRKQSAEIIQRAAYAEQILDNERFAKSAAGVGGPVAVRRVQAAAVAQEHEESRKRIASAQQLMSYRERGMEWEPMLAMYERQYAEAAKAGDYETASAALLNIHSKGAGGRSSAERMLTQYSIEGPTTEAAETARKEVERTVYESMQLGARSDIVKGSMNLDTGKWELKDVGALATKQIASLDGDILKRALVDDQGRVAMKTVEIKDPQTGQVIRTETKPIISAEQAHEILNTPGLRQEVDDPNLIKLLAQRAPASGSSPSGGGTPPTPPSGGGSGTPPPAPPSGGGPTPPPPTTGGPTPPPTPPSSGGGGTP